LKHRFIDLAHVAFRAGQEVKNEFIGPGNAIKHHFLDFSKLTFCAVQRSENEFTRPSNPFETSLQPTLQVAFLYEKMSLQGQAII
jgi:hypothetical protein